MLFNSFEFLIFFPLVVFLNFLLPHKYRWFLLLVTSCIFYMFFIPAYILILFLLITIDYSLAIFIEESSGRRRKILLAMSIVSTCLVLFIFKYFNFFNSNLTALAQFLGWHYNLGVLKIILPIGLSFHTFQSLSYVIEVYRGQQKTERHFGIYALYVMFFPQLVAGPIERPQNLLHQFYKAQNFDYTRARDGLLRMLGGFFKKIVIADHLAYVVNSVYNDPSHWNGPYLLLATYFFAFQIYCDFSGYSDIAIGAAQVLGYDLMENFKRPYFATSIPEFWRKWHISLSTWFRDYLYIPLGGNRIGKRQWFFNILIVFMISGVWHGANWTFLIWGLIHGIFMLVFVETEKFRANIAQEFHIKKFLWNMVNIFITFQIVVFAWIFFRANSLADAVTIITNLFNRGPTQTIDSRLIMTDLYLIGILIAGEIYQHYFPIRKQIAQFPVWVRWPVYYILFFLTIFWANFDSHAFIYFQF